MYKHRNYVIFFFILYMSVVAVGTSFCEAKFSGEINLYNGLLLLQNKPKDEINSVAYIASGYSRLAVHGSSKNVRGQFAIDGTLGTSYSGFDIYRAYIRTRFDWFRFSIGKNALSISDGFYYNAGDVIFGSSPNADAGSFSSLNFRDNARWYNSFQFYLERFTFIEILAFAPSFTLSDLTQQKFPDIKESGIGARIVGKIDLVKLEGGYFFEGLGTVQSEEVILPKVRNIHKLYANIQFPLYFDWNISTSMELPQNNITQESTLDGLQASFGMFKNFQLDNANRTLSIRLEALFRPGMPFTANTSINIGPKLRYGAEVFLQLGFDLGNDLSLTILNVFSPVDLSALLNIGLNWGVYEGLNLYTNIATQIGGDQSDVYYFYKDGGMSFILGAKYKF